jgi:hypothetical protein
MNDIFRKNQIIRLTVDPGNQNLIRKNTNLSNANQFLQN